MALTTQEMDNLRRQDEALPTKTASERARELMELPNSELPVLAVKFRDAMFQKHAACAEIAIMAFEIYAQYAEKLPGQYNEVCDDVAYFGGLQIESAVDAM